MRSIFTPFFAARRTGLTLSALLLGSSAQAGTSKAKVTPVALGAEIGTAGYTWLDHPDTIKLSNLQAALNWHPSPTTFTSPPVPSSPTTRSAPPPN